MFIGLQSEKLYCGIAIGNLTSDSRSRLGWHKPKTTEPEQTRYDSYTKDVVLRALTIVLPQTQP